jgi:CoA-substrate-specific enzyme activase, putative
MKKLLNIGIDVGSTTVKFIVLNNKLEVIFSKYERHFSDTKKAIISLLEEIIELYEDYNFRITMTGSGSLEISEIIGIPFIQEVIACKNAVKKYEDRTDVAIELGGEDAKIIYFGSSIEQRMNGSCAGGTGAFLDQIAILLNTDAIGLNELAKTGTNIYPIASRCGVFAKTDIQPLINEGADKGDIALSIMQAVVNQTISGLACGKPIRGNVLFLGGPLNYLSELRKRFVSTLDLKEDEILIPENGHLFVCLGAAIANLNANSITSKELKNSIKLLKNFKSENNVSLEALFRDEDDYNQFKKRHEKAVLVENELSEYSGDAFLGIDAGSTTAKLVLINPNGELLYSDYRSNKGTPLDTVKEMLTDLYSKLPRSVVIRLAGSTGYGETLIKTAFNLDVSEIETMAHYKAASYFKPNVDSIIDIGGQDMKYIKIKEGVVNTIMLNEACSSGCGSFIESLTKSLDVNIDEFVNLAVSAKTPVDLGSRCTVFMNSKIKQTQKEGKSLGDIFAGLSYSVVKNAILKVMKIRDISSLGKNVVVQGGTFLNDAVLRAFEIVTERKVIRPNIAGLMGAYGVALICSDEFLEYEDKDISSSILTLNEIKNLKVKTTHTRCKRCENNCGLTINMFNDKKLISGNRCEKGSGDNGSPTLLPNMYKYKYEKLFDRKSLEIENATRGIIGIPRVLNMYENYPFWHTFFTELGFKVVLSDQSTRSLYESGIESMPSESVCYPAKLVHGHIMNLIKKDVKTIFYPCLIYEKEEFENIDNCYNCPIVTSYSEAIKLNVEDLKDKNIKFLNPFLPIKDSSLQKKIKELDEFKEFNFTNKELKHAIKKAKDEDTTFKKDIILKSDEFLEYIMKNNEKGIILAGRPYHIDPEINHGIDSMINNLGLAVLTEDSICYKNSLNKKFRVVDQWTYHSRLYRAADAIAKYDNLEFVQLNSFGCGLDAITTDQVEDILIANDKLYTTIKIDEISNLGAVKIRMRSLIAAMNKRTNLTKYHTYGYEKTEFTKEMKKTHTILCPDLSPYHFELIEAAMNNSGYNFVHLKDIDEEMINVGLRYVNNDACYPSLIVIGQLITALKSGKYDPDNLSLIISQTGGGCRASNYIGLLRKAIIDAGYPNIPIISFNAAGMDKNPGFKLNLSLINKLLMSIVYSDLLMRLLLSTRPYEKAEGRSQTLYDKWIKICKNSLKKPYFNIYKENIRNIINDFKKIRIENKTIPKVGIVGEILIKYHSFGNNYLLENLEQEGAEVILPDFMGFIKYCAYNNIEKEKLLDVGKFKSFVSKKALDMIDIYEKEVKKNLEGTRFRNVSNIYHLAKNVEQVLSTGNQTGEGWFLTAEMLELMNEGVENIACVQPFACLPNHIVGKAVIKKIRELYPLSNIVAIDYDPGASHSNQINRVKLMLTVAKDNLTLVKNKESLKT